MKIRDKWNHVHNASQIFPSLDEWVDFVIKNGTNLNNEVIVNQYYTSYDHVITEDILTTFTELIKQLKNNCLLKFSNKLKMSQVDYWTERGWTESSAERKVEELKSEKRKRSKLCVEYWLNKGFTEEEGRKKISELQKFSSSKVKKRNPQSKNKLKLLGWDEKDIDNFMKSRSRYSIEYWLKRGFSEQEGKERISQLQSKNSEQYALKRKIEPEKYWSSTNTRPEFWISRGYSYNEAKEKITERQKTFTLDKCIEKYGFDEGNKIYSERQIKWNNSLLQNGNLKRGFSKMSQELFYKILEKEEFKNREKIFFATKNNEYRIKTEKSFWLYDYTDLDKMKIIEYNGDMYHGNPAIYCESDTPHPFRKHITAREMWNKDAEKIKAAEQEGFTILVVWDSDYRKNPEAVINTCLEFLKH